MKIREGFVSNSSTTSFCAVGMSFEKEDLIKILIKNFIPDYSEEVPTSIDTANYEDISIHIEKLLDKKNCKDIDVWTNYDDYLFLGTSIDHMKDTDTLYHFKRKTEMELSKIVSHPSVDLIVDTIYN